MKLLIVLSLIAFLANVKGRKKDTEEEKKCEELHGQCISNNMNCHPTQIIPNSECSSDKICCTHPNKENGEIMLKQINKCKAKKKCSKKGGVCKKQCSKLEKKTKGCIKKKGCKCCIQKCKPKTQCTEAGGFCVKETSECKGTLSKGCKGRGCRCCVEGKSCPYHNSMADSTNLRQVEECTWVVGNDCYPENPPLFVYENDLSHLILPLHENGENIVRIPVGSILFIACSGSLLEEIGEQYIRARCNESGRFEYGDQEYTIKQMNCAETVKSVVRKSPLRGPCGLNRRGDEYSIGFEVHNNRYLPLIDVCFCLNGDYVTSLWSQHTIRGSHLPARPAGISRLRRWVNDPRFSSLTQTKMDLVYTQREQRTYLIRNGITMPELDGGTEDMYQKGHLATRTDFITQAESDATFHYINALPQYGVINNGNWRVIENWANNLARELHEDITIFSGGFGVLNLLDTNNQNRLPIYLGHIVDPPSLGEVPVPAAFWKIVIHEQSAIAFVVNNNPIENNVPEDLCPDICERVFNLPLRDFARYGFTLCCDVNTLKDNLDNNDIEFEDDLPNVDYTDILLGVD